MKNFFRYCVDHRKHLSDSPIIEKSLAHVRMCNCEQLNQKLSKLIHRIVIRLVGSLYRRAQIHDTRSIAFECKCALDKGHVMDRRASTSTCPDTFMYVWHSRSNEPAISNRLEITIDEDDTEISTRRCQQEKETGLVSKYSFFLDLNATITYMLYDKYVISR